MLLLSFWLSGPKGDKVLMSENFFHFCYLTFGVIEAVHLNRMQTIRNLLLKQMYQTLSEGLIVQHCNCHHRPHSTSNCFSHSVTENLIGV